MSLFEDTYLTIETVSEGIFRDKGSKFHAYAFPFRSEATLKDTINKLKALHPKARHHCWAYRLSTDRSVWRINDDGEPSGTAGKPILNVLLSKDITNVLVVVVRYFGGTLLGVPGLINAYKNATVEALASAQVVERTVNDVYRIDFDYLRMNDIMRLVKDENLTILKQDFDNTCSLEVEIRKTQVNQVVHQLETMEGVNYFYLTTL